VFLPADIAPKIKDRFVSSYEVDQETGCWLWVRMRTPNGYGRFHCRNRKWRAHRAAYTIFVGDIPPGMCICHHCDTPLCVNPAHLFVGTQRDNVHDMIRKGRKAPSPLPLGVGARVSRDTNYKRIGELNGKAILNGERALLIAFSKERIATLAARYGVSPTTVGHVRGGRSWTHITGIGVK